MTDFQQIELQPQIAAVRHAKVPMSELKSFFGAAFGEVMAVLQAQGVAVAGEPFGFYEGMPGELVDVAAGFPTGGPVRATGNAEPMLLPGGRAVTGVHVGPYETMEQTYAALLAWMAAHGLVPAERMWECYLSDPAAEPDPATWRTRIVWPVREDPTG